MANLLYWPSVDTGWFAVPMGNDAYPRTGPYRVPVDGRAIRRAVSLFDHAGLIDIIPGQQRCPFPYVNEAGDTVIGSEPRVTLIRATPTLAALFASHNLTGLGSTIKVRGIQQVLLKDSKRWGQPGAALLSYDSDNPVVRADRRDIDRINAAIRNAVLAYHGDEVIDINHRWLCRHYTRGDVHGMRMKLGGRFFGERGYQPCWYELDHSDRITNLRINGERLVGLDFGNAFARLAYAGTGVEPPEGDLYAIPWVTSGSTSAVRAARRKCVKAVFASLVFRDQRPRRWPGDSKGHPIDHPEGADLDVILNQIEVMHPALLDSGRLYSQEGHKLMYLESQIIKRALLTLIAANVIALPVHDCLVVAQRHRNAAETAMREAWGHLTQGSVPCEIDAEYPADHPESNTPDTTEGSLSYDF